MTKGTPELKIGDPIPGKRVDSLTIARIVDPPVGHVLIDQELGNVHVYWNRWVIQEDGTYKKELTHHGGPGGFDDIQLAIDQHQRVIGRYMGVETTVEDALEPQEDDLQPPFTLRTYAQALRIGYDRVEIPGERAWISDCLTLVERTIRGASLKMPASELQMRLSFLSRLQPKFDKSKTPNMQQASVHLLQAVEAAQAEKRDESMAALLKMGTDVTKRSAEISKILSATIKRDSLLEGLRNSMEDIVVFVHRVVLREKVEWDNTADDQKRQEIILRLARLLSLRGVDNLTVQPFRSRAQRRILGRLQNLTDDWTNGDVQQVGKVLTEGALELIEWKKQIRKRVEGEYSLRFPPS